MNLDDGLIVRHVDHLRLRTYVSSAEPLDDFNDLPGRDSQNIPNVEMEDTHLSFLNIHRRLRSDAPLELVDLQIYLRLVYSKGERML